MPTPTQVAKYDTSLLCSKSYLVLVYCRLVYICYLVPDHIFATLWVCGIVIVFCKFQFIALFESLHRPLPLPLGEVPKAERAVGAGNVMVIIEA